MKNLRTVLILGAVFCIALPVMGVAAEVDVLKVDQVTGALFLEMGLRQEEDPPKTCDHAHYPPTCQKFHLKEVEEVRDGLFRITLDNDLTYDMAWSGNGVRLETGIVIAPKGDPNAPSGWTQVWPTIEDIVVDEWKDADGNSFLSVSDTVTIEGESVKVKDAYYFMWLQPVK